MLSELLQQPKFDYAALKQLTDMGFPEAHAKKALVINKWFDMPLPELEEPITSSSQDRELQGAEGGLLQTGGEPTSAGSEGGLLHYTSILGTIRAL
ncbi:hypothetical protein C0Q70_10762 [Pomacea canaliculata]|uniref:UBA domain-containing protein n=2 Tax=Pomacea canaliculata TaxID=400727 RepID=A0A2T7P440_POMCA|nr:hypothetical protein C0Q70_10762 [Pomacea canaliculata]